MISFTQSRCNNHKPGMAHVFATPGGQSFLHLEVLSTILLWRCRHLRIPQLDKNSTTPPSPTDPTIDSIEPRKITERRFWIWIQSQLIFNYINPVPSTTGEKQQLQLSDMARCPSTLQQQWIVPWHQRQFSLSQSWKQIEMRSHWPPLH